MPNSPARPSTSSAKTAAKTAKPAAKVPSKAAKPAAKAAVKAAAKPAAAATARRTARASEPAGSGAASPSGQEQKASLKVGDRAPGFALAGDDGREHALAGLQGRRVVLYFYPRDSTPGCTVEACDFRDRQAAFTAAGVTVLGVSGDDLKSHTRFRGKQALNFPLLSDPDHAVASAYGAFGSKMMYGRAMQGIIRSTFLIGKDGRIEAMWQPVKVPGHAEAVLQAVGAAG